MCPILHAFPCQSYESTLQCSSLQCRLQGMHLYLSSYGKSISIWPEKISDILSSFAVLLLTVRQNTYEHNTDSLTFIGGDAHIDSCIILRKAFSWRVSFYNASWCKGPQSRVNYELSSGSCFLICRYCSRSLAPVPSSQCFLCGVSSILFNVC